MSRHFKKLWKTDQPITFRGEVSLQWSYRSTCSSIPYIATSSVLISAFIGSETSLRALCPSVRLSVGWPVCLSHFQVSLLLLERLLYKEIRYPPCSISTLPYLEETAKLPRKVRNILFQLVLLFNNWNLFSIVLVDFNTWCQKCSFHSFLSQSFQPTNHSSSPTTIILLNLSTLCIIIH